MRFCPYNGLVPYREEDAAFFFGRERETRLIINNLFAARLTVLYGANGVGKSSVLHAGVVPRLRQREQLIVIAFNKWRSNPVRELKAAVAEAADYAAHPSLALTDSTSLIELIQECTTQMDSRLMIILDQFEEYFHYQSQRDEFAEAFAHAVNRRNVPINFLISIREDSLGKLDRFEPLVPNLLGNGLRLEHLDLQAAQAAIQEPVNVYNKLHEADGQPFNIEQSLVEAVLQQVQSGKVTLGEVRRAIIKNDNVEVRIETPYLQLVMTRLWDEEIRAGSSILRFETLQQMGGANNVMRNHLDTALANLPTEEQHIAVRVFRYLVTPSGTKIAHTVSDLATYTELSQEVVEAVLNKLAALRILRGYDQLAELHYEIFHDVLASPILNWLRQKDAEIQVRRERQRTQRLVWWASGLGTMLLLMSFLAFYSVQQRLAAQQAEALAKDQLAISLKNSIEAERAFRRIAEQAVENSRRAAELAQFEAEVQRRRAEEVRRSTSEERK